MSDEMDEMGPQPKAPPSAVGYAVLLGKWVLRYVCVDRPQGNAKLGAVAALAFVALSQVVIRALLQGRHMARFNSHLARRAHGC